MTRYDVQGRPISATITLDSDGDNNGEDAGWHFGLDDEHLFTALATPFHGTIPGSGDYSDYYRTIAHELGHAVGIDASPAMGRYIRSAGRDQVNPADLYRFYNPSGQFRVRATFTAFDGMHFYEGPPDPNWPPQPTHQHDLLNAGRTVKPPPTVRQLISDLTIQVLAEAYAYNVTLPSQVDTLCVARNPATGQPVVRGPEGDSDDAFTLHRVGDNVEVLVNGTRELVPFAQIGSIGVTGGDRDDTIYGGAGNDQIHGGYGDDSLFGDEGDDTIWGDDGNDYINCGGGADCILAGAGNDEIYTNFWDEGDYIDGGSGEDWAYIDWYDAHVNVEHWYD